MNLIFSYVNPKIKRNVNEDTASSPHIKTKLVLMKKKKMYYAVLRFVFILENSDLLPKVTMALYDSKLVQVLSVMYARFFVNIY